MHQHIADNANVFTRDPLFDGLEWLAFFGLLCLGGLALPVVASTPLAFLALILGFAFLALILGFGFAWVWVRRIELDNDNHLKISTIIKTSTFQVSDLLDVLIDRTLSYPTGPDGSKAADTNSTPAGTTAVFRFSTDATVKLRFLSEAEFRRLEAFALLLKSRNNTIEVSMSYHYRPFDPGSSPG